MTTRTYSLVLDGSNKGVLPSGVFFYVKAATAALTIRTRGKSSSPIEFANVGAGLKFGPVDDSKRWTYLDVDSAVPQTIEVVVSDDAEVDIASTVNVAGSVTVAVIPSTAVATPARTNVPASQTLLIAANPLRKRVTVQVPVPVSSGVNVGPAGGVSATRGFQVGPGESAEFVTTAALYAFAVVAAEDVQVFEEL